MKSNDIFTAEQYNLLDVSNYRDGAPHAVFDELRQQRPLHHMIAMLDGASYAGDPITDEEYLRFFVIMIAAGFETAHTALAQSMLLLVNHQDIYDEWKRGDVKLLVGAIDEFLRMVTPAMHTMRSTKVDIEMHGIGIPAGERVTLWFAAANRDPALFKDAHQLDIRRNNASQACFGTDGAHFCIGNRLARLEMNVMFSKLLRRCPKFALNGEVVRVKSNVINGLRRLPVRIIH